MDYSDLTLDHSEWKTMLPPDKQELVWKSLSLIFFLDQRTGKNCFLLGVPNLKISSEGALNKYPHRKSRFLEVAEIKYTKMIRIQGTVKTQMLSPYTYYGAILVFGSTEDFPVSHKANTSIKILGGEPDDYSRKQDRIVHFQTGIVRADGWMEIEVGDFYVGLGDNTEIQVQLAALNGYPKSGIIIEGIELRPWKS
ncbi:hypothetical protein Pfo_026618 [Paulownia fortunei]|nr:hypothetical protein Pfo_026618 [Paulownia fortunei]